MVNIETMPSREFKIKSSKRDTDPENLILTSEQSVAKALAKKKAKEAKELKKLPKIPKIPKQPHTTQTGKFLCTRTCTISYGL